MTYVHLSCYLSLQSTLQLSSVCKHGCRDAGADVGGFFGNAEAELIVRWNQLATYYPFFRGHGHLETKRREPWLFGPDNSRRNRQALRERYALLPYLYTLFWEAHTLGLPIMRPMYYEFPQVSHNSPRKKMMITVFTPSQQD